MIIDCKAIEEDIMNETKNLLIGKVKPTLAIVSCGLDEPSKVYIRNKIKKCESIGINVVHYMAGDYDDCVELIKDLNSDDGVTAIMLQLPTKLNKDDERDLLDMIDVNKDVDGLSTKSQMKHIFGKNLPCTSMAVLRIIKEQYGDDLSGKRIALYGRSDLVNRPLIQVLLDMNASVTIYHSKSNIGDTLSPLYDIHVVAIGKPKYFKCGGIHKQLIIDVGINRDENGKLCGDVNTDGYEVSKYIHYTPVPGGVGILTTSMLCYKIAEMAKRSG